MLIHFHFFCILSPPFLGPLGAAGGSFGGALNLVLRVAGGCPRFMAQKMYQSSDLLFVPINMIKTLYQETTNISLG